MEKIEALLARPLALQSYLRTLALFLLRSSLDMPEGYPAGVSMAMAHQRRQSSHVGEPRRLLIPFLDQI